MPKVITNGKDVAIGAFMFPDRKKPSLCIKEGNEIVSYGTFNSEETADNFMTKLAFLLGIKEEEK